MLGIKVKCHLFTPPRLPGEPAPAAEKNPRGNTADDLPQREKNKQKEKWKAASSAYRERKKMANAVLDLTPPSMEDIPLVLVDVD